MHDNAIAKELAKLDEQWEDFISSKKPLLRWYFHPNNLPLARGFIRYKEQFNEKNPELYIELHSEFADVDKFGYTLAQEFNTLIASTIAEALDAPSETPDANEALTRWVAPSLADCSTGHAALIRSLLQIVKHFEEYVHYIVVFIAPTSVKNPNAYVGWWQQYCAIVQKHEWPPILKLVTFDSDSESELKRLSTQYPQQLESLDASIDFRNAINHVLDDADDGSAHAAFRKLNVQLQQAAGDRNGALLQETAEKALAIAKQQRWIDLAAAVLLTRAAGYINLNAHDRALDDYRLAQTVTQQGINEQVAGCDKLFIQAMIAEGTCLFILHRFAEAAAAYKNAAIEAEKQKDLFYALEGWRMASFCLERAKQLDLAWDFALKGLAVGDAMPEDMRANSTLPFLGQSLLRISPNQSVDLKIRERFDRLLGPDWLQKVEALSC